MIVLEPLATEKNETTGFDRQKTSTNGHMDLNHDLKKIFPECGFYIYHCF